MSEFRRVDTKKADGVYIAFERIEREDAHASPKDYLFQDPEYQQQDQERFDAWRRDEWYFIGIQAKATILIVKNGTGTYHEMMSAGIWGIESDSGEDYLAEVFGEELEELKSDIAALAAGPITYVGEPPTEKPA